MYAWIWRMLPLGVWGKLVTTVLLIVGIAALLWFVVFPAVDPLLPFNELPVTAPGN